MTASVFRFAPSPNGRLHLGHAYSALLNADLAKRMGANLLLRIEDLDSVRSRLDFAAAIETDLAWLGLRFASPPLRQSERLPFYRSAIDGLARRSLAYPCFCSRGTIAATVAEHERTTSLRWPRDPDGSPLYPRTCRSFEPSEAAARIAAGAPHAWRLDMEKVCAVAPGPHRFVAFDSNAHIDQCLAEPRRWGDVVIGRREVPASYHLAVVTDDAVQGVTHVVRGTDLLAATDIHVLLQALLGLPTPQYHHHGLIRDEAGDKLAKSRGSLSLADLRAAGWSLDDVRTRLGLG